MRRAAPEAIAAKTRNISLIGKSAGKSSVDRNADFSAQRADMPWLGTFAASHNYR